MSENTASFFVYGAPVSFLLQCYHYRMMQRQLILALPEGHSAEVINLWEWRASRDSRPH